MLLHPVDGAARGIRSGDVVLVRSARGEARFTAELTDDTREGVAVVEGIWWNKHQPGGRGVNASHVIHGFGGKTLALLASGGDGGLLPALTS